MCIYHKGGIIVLSLQETEKSDMIRNRPEIQMSSFTIIDKYKDMIYRTALTLVTNHADAEDILQEVFFKYFCLHPVFQSDAHEKAWFLRVTINEGKNLLRSAWKCRRTDFDLDALPQPITNEQDSEVLQAVMSLPEKYRIVIYLYYYENYSVKEIADITAQSESAVSQQMTRARRKLRKKLEG